MRGRVPHTLPRRVGSLLAAPRQSSECSWHHLLWLVGPSLPVRLQKRSSFTWAGYTPSPVRIWPLNPRGGHPSAEGCLEPVGLNCPAVLCSLLTVLLSCLLPSCLDKDIHTYTSLLGSQPASEGQPCAWLCPHAVPTLLVWGRGARAGGL